MPEWLKEQAINETIFREMNEWAEETSDARLGTDRLTDDLYLCECSDATCSDPIRLSRSEYESVRSNPVWFAIAIDHENPLVDKVLAENLRFATVEKFLGEAAAIARATDPRR